MGIKGLILEITQLKVSFVKINEIEKKVLTQISRTDIILYVTKTTSSIPTRWWVW